MKSGNYPDNFCSFLMNRDNIGFFIAIIVNIPVSMLFYELMGGIKITVL